ncbi:dihydrodipicolinate synthase family protein [Paenibacillus thalictri]|uniref:Dihydrodipicolinate synthase family protein n=1 Tax=Paenibacillus thalictri TaxID=2527873 RepID=A0A4Q9DJR4_9BACL|nr:dihydrodipicolinate synthase family protein [Paenibacillus thalictri]TBL73281.1 dihydrodipicolinate synthase family protein [Paenibacillus thalictri]
MAAQSSNKHSSQGLHGIISAMVTPLNTSGDDVDLEGVSSLVQFLLEKGVHGLFPLGSTGEGVLLTEKVRMKMAEKVVREVQDRVPVIIHSGAFRAEEVIRLAKHAEEIGADGVSVIPPSYYTMDEQALMQYFSVIAEQLQTFPVYLYNIPSNAKNAISVSLFAKLSQRHANIRGMKESSMDFSNFYELVQAATPEQVTLMGNDDQIFAALCIGGSGAISAGSTAVPEPYVELYKAFRAGDMQMAFYWQTICSKVKKMLVKSCPVAPHKKVLQLRNVMADKVSPPLRQLNDKETADLQNSLQGLGYLSC